MSVAIQERCHLVPIFSSIPSPSPFPIQFTQKEIYIPFAVQLRADVVLCLAKKDNSKYEIKKRPPSLIEPSLTMIDNDDDDCDAIEKGDKIKRNTICKPAIKP
ncbi:hypothetical protein EYC84_005603 [Monilinia fructicola]|uniref:Uncharacterized protein n=1 Tax=Monilinia fructicola TaxID=38448 RepID=A0A5M9K0W2_MONFR|nr:hypothetical protein EYC84_005603 [Monilinia fructicola]